MKKLMLTLLSVTLLGACQFIPERQEVSAWQLPPAQVADQEVTDSIASLRIARPEVTDLLSGSRILVLTTDHRFESLPASRWSSAIPDLWHDWLTDLAWRDPAIMSVSKGRDGLTAELELRGTLRAFHLRESDGGMVAELRYDAQLLQVQGRELLASQTFTQQVSTDSATPAAAVKALGQAAEQVGEELIAWLLSHQVNH